MSFRPATDFETACLKRGYFAFKYIEYLRDEVCDPGTPLEKVLDVADMLEKIETNKQKAVV